MCSFCLTPHSANLILKLFPTQILSQLGTQKTKTSDNHNIAGHVVVGTPCSPSRIAFVVIVGVAIHLVTRSMIRKCGHNYSRAAITSKVDVW